MLLVVYYLLPLFLRLDDGQRSAFAEEEHGRDPAPYLILIAKLQGTKRDQRDRLPQSRRAGFRILIILIVVVVDGLSALSSPPSDRRFSCNSSLPGSGLIPPSMEQGSRIDVKVKDMKVAGNQRPLHSLC